MTAAPAQNVSLEIETGKMDGKPGYPKFVPADLTVHLGTPVALMITSYDDGTAPLPASLATYETIQGGTETVDGTAVTSVPNANISHTFSVPNLGVNVLIPAVPPGAKTTTVTFTFTPTKTGTFTWHCFAPCGSGSDGMSGAMATMGWMEGNITVS
jgi:plastocyanin